MINRDNHLLPPRVRGARASVQTLGLCALLLTVSHAALAKDDLSNTKLEAPAQSSGLFMEQATYGDVIGLQPGFEQATTGKAISIKPTTPYKKAPLKSGSPAKLQNTALNAPKGKVQAPAQQFVTDIAPILPPEFMSLALEPYNKERALLSSSDIRDIQRKQRKWEKARKKALAELKKANKIVVAAPERDLDQIKAIADQRPALALSTFADDALSGAVVQPQPIISIQTITLSTSPENTGQEMRFANSEGMATTLDAVTRSHLTAVFSDLDMPSGLDDSALAPVDPYPAEWADVDVAAVQRPASLFSATAYSEIDSEILAEIAAFNPGVSATDHDRVLYTPQIIAQVEGGINDGLTKAQSLAVIDMVGLPGDAQILDVKNEDRATLVASVKNTSTEYEPQPIGVGGLETLRDAVEHAVATNPDIKIAEAQQEDAYYAVNEARAGFLPKLDLNAGAGPEISRQSGQEEIVRIRREVNATLRQTVFDFGLTRYDYLRAKEGYESAKLDTLQSIEELVYDVSVAYLGVLQQQKVVALAHQNLEAHEGILKLVNAQKEAGQGTAADVNRVSSSLANARSFMLEEESKLQQSRDQYRRLLNAPPGLLVDPLLDLSLLPNSANEAAERIETESPRLLQVKADEKSVRNQLRSQRGNYLPKVEVEVQGNLNTDLAGETGQTRDARAMMFLRYNLYNGGADAAVAARLRARVKEVGYDFEKQRREVEQNIRNDFTAIDASRAKVETIRDQVDTAKEVVRLYEEQFRAGDRTAFDLLDAQQALITAKLEQVLNTYQETRAGFRVMQQLGSLYYALTADG